MLLAITLAFHIPFLASGILWKDSSEPHVLTTLDARGAVSLPATSKRYIRKADAPHSLEELEIQLSSDAVTWPNDQSTPTIYSNDGEGHCTSDFIAKSGLTTVEACANACWEEEGCLQFSQGGTTGCRLGSCDSDALATEEAEANGAAPTCASPGYCGTSNDAENMLAPGSAQYTMEDYRYKAVNVSCDTNYVYIGDLTIEECHLFCENTTDCKTFSAGDDCSQGCRVSQCGTNHGDTQCHLWGACETVHQPGCNSYEVKFVSKLQVAPPAPPPPPPPPPPETQVAPTAPFTLTLASPTATEVVLTWSAPASDGGSALSGYQVSIDDFATAGTDVGLVTTHSMTGQTAGTALTCSVRAVNAVGNGPSKSETITVGAPAAPATLTLTSPVAQQVTFSWSVPTSDGGSTVTGYEVSNDEFLTNTQAVPVNPGDGSLVTTYDMAGQTTGAALTCSVRAVNAVGTGPPTSSTVTVT